MYEHKFNVHPDIDEDFKPQARAEDSKEFVLNLLVEQNMALLEEFNNLKEFIKDSFVQVSSDMKECLGNSKKETEAGLQKHDDKIEEYLDKAVKKANQEVEDSKIKKESVIKTRIVPKKSKNSKLNVAWVGTSISNVLDHKKFEKDTNTNVNIVEAYGISEESQATFPNHTIRFPHKNFENIVPEVLDSHEVDVLVLEAGSMEISNIKVNEAMMDTSKDIENYKKEWFQKVEDDSKNLYKLAENAIKKNSSLKVVILKRLSRFDRSSQDILGIKAKLSTYANQTYDQLWLKSGSPENIHISELNLSTETNSHLRNLIFGNISNEGFDGVHLRGVGAARHFTYRSGQVIKAILPKTERSQNSQNTRSSHYSLTFVKIAK